MDNRAEIKIDFTIYGKTYKVDMSINYHPDYDTVQTWFEECYRDARAHYEAERYEAERDERERREKESELAELARLKAKYEGEAIRG